MEGVSFPFPPSPSSSLWKEPLSNYQKSLGGKVYESGFAGFCKRMNKITKDGPFHGEAKS